MKVLGPVFSIHGRGKLGNAIVYQKNGFALIARKHVPTIRRKSIAQSIQRSEYGNASAEWRVLTPELKAYYEREAKKYNLHGFNLFLRDWFKYRYACRYGYTYYGHGVYGMDREFEKYPEKIQYIK
ncbi:MAG: hypothetical protein DRP09_15395 [Candidatus Thorarchaeota archaeon]|nr:MAG: hypothetical protein DRP09_15395 [Candidatus Thorarchaeota archaeon]